MPRENETVARRVITRVRAFAGDHYPDLVLAVLTVLLATAFVSTLIAHTGGLVAPLDDAYIHFNYARHMAEGWFYQYNPGDGTSTGATSLLWTPLLAFGYLIGFKGNNLLLWAILLNTVFLYCYGALLYRMALLFFEQRLLALLTALVIFCDGRVLWGFFSGMEIGVYQTLLVLALHRFAVFQRDGEPRQFRVLILALCGLVLVRPEGHFLAAFLVLVFVGWRVASGPPGSRWAALRGWLARREWPWLALPFVLILGQYLLFYLTTGEMTQNGMRTKSHLYAPDQTLWGVMIPSFKFYFDMIFRHFPYLFDKSLRHVMDVFFFLGFLFWMGHEAKHRRPGMFWTMALWFFGGLLLQSIILNAAYHHGRYQMNYTFIFWFAFISGIHCVFLQLRVEGVRRQIMMGGLLGFFILAMSSTVVKFTQLYGRNASDIWRQHVATAQYIDKHLPADAAVGMNDAGVIAYFGNRYVFDVFGLTTNVTAARKWEGEACIFEQIYHLDPKGTPRRPDHFAIYTSWYPRFTKSGAPRELARFHLNKTSIAGGKTKVVLSIDWDVYADKTIPYQAKASLDSAGFKVVDQIDIAYRPDEIAHEYAFWHKERISERGSGLLRHMTYVGGQAQLLFEGGRTIREKEAFTVRNLDPSLPLRVIRRGDRRSCDARVFVDDVAIGVWSAAVRGGKGFGDDFFEIPASALHGPQARLRLEAIGGQQGPPPPSDKRRAKKRKRKKSRGKINLGRALRKAGKRKLSKRPEYNTYYYWFAQSASAARPVHR